MVWIYTTKKGSKFLRRILCSGRGLKENKSVFKPTLRVCGKRFHSPWIWMSSWIIPGLLCSDKIVAPKKLTSLYHTPHFLKFPSSVVSYTTTNQNLVSKTNKKGRHFGSNLQYFFLIYFLIVQKTVYFFLYLFVPSDKVHKSVLFIEILCGTTKYAYILARVKKKVP